MGLEWGRVWIEARVVVGVEMDSLLVVHDDLAGRLRDFVLW